MLHETRTKVDDTSNCVSTIFTVTSCINIIHCDFMYQQYLLQLNICFIFNIHDVYVIITLAIKLNRVTFDNFSQISAFLIEVAL